MYLFSTQYWGFLLAIFLFIPNVKARDPLILLGVDGFRYDYLTMADTPHMDAMIQRGFQARRMLPSYPSFTFPNMYTLVTGNHPSTHGVTGSKTYDEKTGEYFDRKNDLDNLSATWFQSMPIWEAAERQGVKTAVYNWVGSLVTDRKPQLLIPFELEDLSTYYDVRLEKFREWFSMERPPELVCSYLFPLDKAGHDHGPGSPELVAGLKELDKFMGDLLQLLDELKVNANILVVSDHGMLPLKQGGTLLADVHKALEGEDPVKVINQYTRLQIFLKDPSQEHVRAVINKLPKFSHLRWYTRRENPYPVHPTRDGHIIGEMDPPYEFMKNRDPKMGGYTGVHGYGPHVPEMAAICFGTGPGFVSGSKLEQVQAVDVFPLMLRLLDLPQRTVDGSLGVWNGVIHGVLAGGGHSD